MTVLSSRAASPGHVIDGDPELGRVFLRFLGSSLDTLPTLEHDEQLVFTLGLPLLEVVDLVLDRCELFHVRDGSSVEAALLVGGFAGHRIDLVLELGGVAVERVDRQAELAELTLGELRLGARLRELTLAFECPLACIQPIDRRVDRLQVEQL